MQLYQENTNFDDGPKTWERRLINKILKETQQKNVNNITRTAAYLQIYHELPELHWSLLAHMVSRNGGWNMTDLRGELLPKIMDENRLRDLFLFLERANATIFRDAYPQLALYRESRKINRPLCHLLPCLGISRFMQPIWEMFNEDQCSPLLTVALIINEQNVIEEKLIKKPDIQKQVLNSFYFKAQSFLRMNQIFFPYDSKGRKKQIHNATPSLAGLIIENFSSLKERIDVGRTLYGLLFGHEVFRSGCLLFAQRQAHTGSRADYWPHLFTRKLPNNVQSSYKPRIKRGKLKKNTMPLCSPTLEQAWPQIKPLPSTQNVDWFRSIEQIQPYLTSVIPPKRFHMERHHCRELRLLEKAAEIGDKSTLL